MSRAEKLDFRKISVLLVDDNPHALELLSQILGGYRVERNEVCASAEEARERVAAKAFDIIIVDAEMPNEDGFSLTREIRRRSDQPNFTAPIILLSANTPLAKVTAARDAGASAVIKKPVAPGVLLNRITWLARHSREFVQTSTYIGPDRRFKQVPLPAEISERRADALALMASFDGAMSQDDVNSLFG